MSKSMVHVEVQRRSNHRVRWVLLYGCSQIAAGSAPTKSEAWARGHRYSTKYRDQEKLKVLKKSC